MHWCCEVVGTRLEGVGRGATAVLRLEGVAETLAGHVVAGLLHTVFSVVPSLRVHVDRPTVLLGGR